MVTTHPGIVFPYWRYRPHSPPFPLPISPPSENLNFVLAATVLLASLLLKGRVLGSMGRCVLLWVGWWLRRWRGSCLFMVSTVLEMLNLHMLLGYR
jgi:hypothetical protein